MLKNVKLWYITANGRAMIPRAIFHHMKQPFEDIRIKNEEWPKYKYNGNFEFAVVPVLEIDGKKYSQSHAINQYLARRFDLMGNDVEEDYLITSLLNSYEDISSKSRQVFLSKTDEERKKADDDFMKIHAPFYLNIYENRFKKYGGKYVIGDKFTVADIFLTTYLYNNFLNKFMKEKYGFLLETYTPTLLKHIEKVYENELADYFEKGYDHTENKLALMNKKK